MESNPFNIIDLDTAHTYEKMLFAVYPAGAGGKFLLACLGLSDNMVFQHRKLAEKQIVGDFTQDYKVKYLKYWMAQALEQKQWNDFKLGDGELVGLDPDICYVHQFDTLLQKRFNPIIKKLINKNLYIPNTLHSIKAYNDVLSFWKKSKYIMFTNFEKTIASRSIWLSRQRPMLYHYWSTVKGLDWPDSPPRSWPEFKKLPISVQQELIHDFSCEIMAYFDHHDIFYQEWCKLVEVYAENQNRVFVFDLDKATENEHEYYNAYCKICDWLQISKVPFDIIKDLFLQWKQTIAVT